MERPKQLNQVPPSGSWSYVVPETKLFIESRSSLRELMSRISEHLQVNKLPVPGNLEAMVLDHICRYSPPGFCEGVPTPGAIRVAPLSFFSILSYTQALIFRVVAKDFFVPREEAERRARICVDCPMNLRHICTTCNGLRSWAANMIGRKVTSLDNQLEVCAVCGCLLTAKLHVNLKYLRESEKRLQEYPERCWQHERKI